MRKLLEDCSKEPPDIAMLVTLPGKSRGVRLGEVAQRILANIREPGFDEEEGD